LDAIRIDKTAHFGGETMRWARFRFAPADAAIRER
jgi:hypothetical protein